MSKFNIVPAVELYPFKDALGSLFDKVCNDAKAFIGRIETENGGKNVTAKLSGISVTSKCVIKSKEGYSLQMPLNNPMSILIRFGVEISKLDDTMGNHKVSQDGKTVESGGIQCELPAACVDWINQQRKEAKAEKQEHEKTPVEGAPAK